MALKFICLFKINIYDLFLTFAPRVMFGITLPFERYQDFNFRLKTKEKNNKFLPFFEFIEEQSNMGDGVGGGAWS